MTRGLRPEPEPGQEKQQTARVHPRRRPRGLYSPRRGRPATQPAGPYSDARGVQPGLAGLARARWQMRASANASASASAHRQDGCHAAREATAWATEEQA